MDVPLSQLRVQQRGDAMVVRVEGRATLRQGPAVRRLAECCPVRDVRELVIDLSACTYMDSTFLGTLLCLHRLVACWRNGHYALSAPSPACREHLRQVGMLDVLPIIEDLRAEGSDWTVLDEECRDLGYFKGNVIEAHQALANLPGQSGEEFRSVAKCLAGEASSADASQEIG